MRLFTDYPRLGLKDYRELLSKLPPPTAEQIEAFANYVSQAKSWYKHLPLWPPGKLEMDACNLFSIFDV